MSLRMRVLGALMRPVIRAKMARAEDPAPLRRELEFSCRVNFRAPPFFHAAETRYGAGRALWVTAGPVAPRSVILYLHGGGYIAGSPDTHKKMVARLSRLSGLRAFLPAYRLAPEHPLPAALEDARAAWDHLIALGYRAGDIVIGGDSAGGGLTLALLSQLCVEGTPPRAVFAWSPFTDQTFSGASVRENSRRDHFFPGDRVHDLAAMILGDLAADDLRASPLFAEFPGCPPVLLQASDCEILRDDTIRMEAHLRSFGADVERQMWHGAPHVWQLFDGWFPEAREAIARTASFLRARGPKQVDS